LANPQVASVLLGTAKPSSLERNMELTRRKIAPEDFAVFEPHTLVAPALGAEAVRV
jgi:D-threo-aldose 1-dehydrogenase